MKRLLGSLIRGPARIRFETARAIDPLSLNLLLFNFKDELPAYRAVR
jgi:hypothetical protein